MESIAARPTQTFAILLRQYRLAVGLTQEELAERSAVSQRTVSDLERGLTTRPYRETVRRLSDALDLRRSDRVGFEAAARGFRIAEAFPSHGEAHPTNLPHEITSFVGRETELRLLRELVAGERVRLLTLIGTGGAGKTRLALRAGVDVLPMFPDGVYVVSLAPLDDPELVLPTIATALGVRESPDQSVQEALSDHLRDKEVLLILDNFERLVEAGPTVKGLLSESAGVQVVVTSRVALRLYGEHVFPVSPLAVPVLDRLPPIEDLACCDSVALFVARARAVQPAFALTPENGRPVAAICAHLDGLPLAIELAAGRMRLFSPENLLPLLQSRLAVLVGGARDVPSRQRTLRRTIDWSYSLLAPEDQALFARLSVFAGGWTLEAAEAVCNEEAEPGLVDAMTRLVDSCLVQVDWEESRFSMLETIREYAAEKLQAQDESEETARRHADHFAMAVADSWLAGQPHEREFRQVGAEQDNLRAALAWAEQRGDTELGLRIAVSLNQYWWQKASFTEGRYWLEALLAKQEGAAVYLRAQALLRLGQDAYTLGDFERARTFLQESVRLAEEAGSPVLRSMAVLDLGVVMSNQGDLGQGIPLLEQAVTAAKETGDSRALTRSLALFSYGLVMDGQVERGLLLAEDTLEHARKDGSMRAVVSLLDTIARARFELGDIVRAQAAWREGLQLARDIGFTYQFPYYLEGLARVAAVQGDARRAAWLFSAEEEQRMVTAAPRAFGESRPRDRALALAKEQTDGETWEQAWAEGRAMTIEQAVIRALEECGKGSQSSRC